MPLSLLLLRHAKSDWGNESLDDHDRPLSDRGKVDAKNMAQYLDTADLKPDLVWCSTAVRARRTLKPILKRWTDIPVSYEEGLYLASTEDALSYVRKSDTARRVLLVGHNPTMESLLHQLIDRAASQDSKLMAELSKYPTAALAELSLNISQWQDLGPPCGKLLRFIKPRTLRDADSPQ